jgi:drug/metabolite transporter (DMT)-like permease
VIPSAGLAALRVGGAALAFLVLRRRLNELGQMPRNDLWWLILCSFLGVVFNQLLFLTGLSLTTVINASLLGTTIPVFTLLISILLGQDRPSVRRLLGIALAAGGVIYLIDPSKASFSTQTTLGDLLIVINAICYAAYIVLSKDLFERYGALNVITWIFVIGAIVTVPVGALWWRAEGMQAIELLPWHWLIVLYIILVPTVAAYYLNAWALTRVTPSTVAIYIYLQPLIAFGLAPVLLREKWTFRTLIASLLIFAGVGIVTKRGRSRAVREVAEHPDALAH